MITYVTDVFLSSQRILFFLLSENLDDGYILKLPPSGQAGPVEGSERSRVGSELGEMAVEIENGNFYWEDPDLRFLYKHEKERIAAIKDDNKKKNKKNDGPLNSQEEKNNRKPKNLDGEVVEKMIRTQERLRFSTISLQDSEISTQKTELSERLLETIGSENHQTKSIITEQAYQGIDLNLKNINLKIQKGKCVAIIGKVGSGKSSLLSCLGGELYHKIGSKITLSGSLAYVGQKAWIQSKTIKENILFGKELDEQRYQDSIKFSCMTEDLKILQKKDETLLGDKGVNLSGGQKTRLSIARAMYSNADIYLFDDPISALDIHVGKYVMEEGILGFLRGSTRVVATHAIAYLKLFDYIYVMDGGEIIEEGTFEEIASSKVYREIKESIKEDQQAQKKDKSKRRRSQTEGDAVSKGEPDAENSSGRARDEADEALEELTPLAQSFKALISSDNNNNDFTLTSDKEHLQTTDHDNDQTVHLDDIKDKNQREVIQDIIACEDRKSGNLSFSVVKLWRTLNGGLPATAWLILVLTVSSFSRTGIPFFLQWWSSNIAERGETRIKEFVAIYLSISAITMICDYFRIATNFKNNVEMSKEVNFKMTFRLMHASVNKFFDRVPLGRIINRFMKDTEDIDIGFPWAADRFFNAK